MQSFMTFAIAFALFCASHRSGALGADVEPGFESGEFVDDSISAPVLVQTKWQEKRQQAMLERQGEHSKPGRIALLAEAVKGTAVRVKEAAEEESESIFGTFITTGIIMGVFAYLYKKHVIDGPPPFATVSSSAKGPRVGLFDCFMHPDTCLHVTFCMPVIAAKNYHVTDVLSFWPGCIVTYVLAYSPIWCISPIVRTFLTGKVSEKTGIKNSWMWDLLMSVFCMPCDVGRESLEIDSEIGATITCCCNVTLTPRVIAEVTQAFEKVEENIERSCDKYRLCSGDGH